MPIFPSPAQSETSRVNGGRSSGRPTRKESAANKKIMTRYSPSEYAEIETQAAAAGMKLSQYVRSRSLGKPVFSKEDQALYEKVRDLEQEMMRQGGSFALAARAAGVSPQELNSRLSNHYALLSKIDQVLELVSMNAARRGKRD